MLSTRLYWIPTATPGKLAISPRPREGEWLEGELNAWSQETNIVVSLLEPQEQSELNLDAEQQLAQEFALTFVSFPIPDRGIPSYTQRPFELLLHLKSQLESGRSIVIHCRQGVGRAGMIAASLLTVMGSEPDAAIEIVSNARGVPVPETKEQRQWIQAVAVPHRR